MPAPANGESATGFFKVREKVDMSQIGSQNKPVHVSKILPFRSHRFTVKNVVREQTSGA